MLNLYYTEKMLGLQEVKVKNIRENENSYEIEVEQERKECICPCCGQGTDKIHDYRQQRVKELAAFGKTVILILLNLMFFNLKCPKFCCFSVGEASLIIFVFSFI